MINKILLKGTITYKGSISLNKKGPYMEFGLAYNSLTKIKQVHSITCIAIGKVVQIIDEDLSLKDTIMIVGFLTTTERDLKRTIVLNVESLEPLTTSKNVYFRDDGVDTELFDKWIDGFDIYK